MSDWSNVEIIQQQKALDDFAALKAEINKVKLLIESAEIEKDMAREITESLQFLIDQSKLIESESKYFFELSNCRYLMMSDTLVYIKKLEQEIKELKP